MTSCFPPHRLHTGHSIPPYPGYALSSLRHRTAQYLNLFFLSRPHAVSRLLTGAVMIEFFFLLIVALDFYRLRSFIMRVCWIYLQGTLCTGTKRVRTVALPCFNMFAGIPVAGMR